MLSANQQKFITSLHLKKFRQKYQNFLVEGEKMVKELLQQQRIAPVHVYGTERWAADNAALLEPHYDKFKIASEADLKKVGTLTTPNQVLAVAQLPPSPPLSDLAQEKLTLYLDGLQDPGNLGTILRIADWFGIRYVCCSPDTVDAFHPKTIQAGMGACLRVQVLEDVPLDGLKSQFPQKHLIGAVMDGQSLFSPDVPRTGVLVIGNEGRGIGAAQMDLLTHRVTIPRGPHSDGAESLNAGVATGILVAHLTQF